MRRPLLFAVLGLLAAAAAVLAVGLPTPEPDVPPLPERVPGAAARPAAPAAASETPTAPGSAAGEDPASTPAEAEPVVSEAASAHEAEARARVQRRAQPDARKAASYASAWNGIQYLLSSRAEPEAKAIAAEIVPLVTSFREAYQTPDGADLTKLVATSDALQTRLARSGLVDDKIRGQVSRLERLANEPDALPVLPPAGGPIPGVPSDRDDEPPHVE